MDITVDFINGISLGFEYVPADDENPNAFVIDLLIIRLLFQWD
jgi:hypothetical protein